MDHQYLPQNIDLTPRRHHGFSFLLFIMGALFPPLAVASRFGVGSDFWLNLVLTICGYIPGHGHNFYIQNIRNNKNKTRTPKWVLKYGLVDTTEYERKQRKSQWAARYNDRLPRSTLEGQPLEEGQRGSSASLSSDVQNRSGNAADKDLWRPEEESYYTTNNQSSSSGRWHYPANFDDADLTSSSSRKRSKKEKKDRWARTEDVYAQSEERQRKKKSKKSKKKKKAEDDSQAPADSLYSQDDNSTQFPEDAEGGLYKGRDDPPRDESSGRLVPQKTGDEVFQHQF